MGNRQRQVVVTALVAIAACAPFGDDGGDASGRGPGGKADGADSEPRDWPVSRSDDPRLARDVFGRSLVGVAAPYDADLSLHESEEQLRTDMAFRRETAWQIVGRVLDEVPLLGVENPDERDAAGEAPMLALGAGAVPRVPRWQTWYGVDDLKRMFAHLYDELGEDGRARRRPFGEETLDEVERWNARARERSERWPLERYLRYVQRLGICPPDLSAEECAKYVREICPEELSEEECELHIRGNISGAIGNSRITYSPATIRHLLASYGQVVGCLEDLESLSTNDAPTDSSFAYCFDREFPSDAVLVKAQWVRAEFEQQMPVYDTDAEALTRLLGPASSADWGTGQRQADPGADEIFTIRLRNGNVFRLAGLHIMTKETRHWMWMTMWWSDRPDEDFGADRPAFIRNGLDGVWSNYKMCVASAYEEGDVDPTRSLLLTPSLASALSASGISGAPTWCSNPYLEHGRGNARTNCIGCHQHGGSTHAFDAAGDATAETFDLEAVITNDALFPNNGRSQIRSVFPTDYVWATVRVDDLIQVMGREIEWRDDGDQNSVPGRARRVVELGGDSNEGELTFDVKCTSCHGVDGAGGFGPSLWERVPMRDDIDLATTLIGGRGAMPAWGPVFDDATLGNLVAFLRGRFDGERGAE